jgi:hypothetical protein
MQNNNKLKIKFNIEIVLVAWAKEIATTMINVCLDFAAAAKVTVKAPTATLFSSLGSVANAPSVAT